MTGAPPESSASMLVTRWPVTAACREAVGQPCRRWSTAWPVGRGVRRTRGQGRAAARLGPPDATRPGAAAGRATGRPASSSPTGSTTGTGRRAGRADRAARRARRRTAASASPRRRRRVRRMLRARPARRARRRSRRRARPRPRSSCPRGAASVLVPGIGSITGERRSSQASASWADGEPGARGDRGRAGRRARSAGRSRWGTTG